MLYKEHEAKYQSQTKLYQEKMGRIEGKFKGELSTRVGTVIKKAEEEKSKYDKASKNVMELSDQIKGFMEKFDELKEQISQSSVNFEHFQMESETGKAEIHLL